VGGGVSLKSATGQEFLKTLENWLGSQTKVLVLIRYSRVGGNKDFEFYKPFAALQEGLLRLPAQTCVAVFRNSQLQLRGTVDDEFIGRCLSGVPDGSEYAVLDMALTRLGRSSFLNFSAGESHNELRQDLESRRGKPVAVGEYPPWQEYSPDVITGYVPAEDGKAKRGVLAAVSEVELVSRSPK
jgi:hypothetical protein